jgi:hypothetical protein
VAAADEPEVCPFTIDGATKESFSNESRIDSITRHVIGAFGNRLLSSLTRNEMQQFLDERKTLAASMVDHLRWELKADSS